MILFSDFDDESRAIREIFCEITVAPFLEMMACKVNNSYFFYKCTIILRILQIISIISEK